MKLAPRETRNAETAKALDQVIGFRVRRLQSIFQAHWQGCFAESGISITPVQGGILLLIEENPGLSQIGLASLLRVEAPTLLQALKPLVEKEFVAQTRSPRDSRASALTLTVRGQEVAERTRTMTRAHEADVLHLLTSSERSRLLALLDKAIGSGDTALADQVRSAPPSSNIRPFRAS